LSEPAFDGNRFYRIKRLRDHGGGERNVLDLGFYVYREMPQNEPVRFKGGDVLIQMGKSKFKKVRVKTSTYNYVGRVEKVVDGDTLRVQIDLGFVEMTRQYLRLFGIDAAEAKTKAGQKAKAFVARFFKKNVAITFQSTGRDVYGRYIAHVWSRPEGRRRKGKTYLNNLLLEKQLAWHI